MYVQSAPQKKTWNWTLQMDISAVCQGSHFGPNPYRTSADSNFFAHFRCFFWMAESFEHGVKSDDFYPSSRFKSTTIATDIHWCSRSQAFFFVWCVSQNKHPLPLKDHWSFHQEPCIKDLCNIIAMAIEKRVSSSGIFREGFGVCCKGFSMNADILVCFFFWMWTRLVYS